jgi:S1-C subfamily serine protease
MSRQFQFMSRKFAVLGFTLCVCSADMPVLAQSVKPRQESLSGIVSRTRPSTVFIRVVRADGKVFTGSGLILTSNGVIATAAHVIAGATRVVVRLQDGRELEGAGTLVVDPRLDLAVLQIPAFGLSVATLGNSDSIQVGDRLLAVGAPLGLTFTVSDGLLSAIRVEEGRQLLQLSIPVSPGSSGGPVMTLDGRVIGIVVSGMRGDGAENLNFALPINYLRGYLPLLEGKPVTAFSGNPLERTASLSNESESMGDVPSIVNDKSGIDLRAMDGVSTFRSDVANNVRTNRSASYRITVDANGRSILERTETVVFNQGWRDKAVDHFRTEVDLDRHSPARTYYVRTTDDAGWRTEPLNLIIADGRGTVTSGAREVTARIPIGTFPWEMSAAVIGSLPENLPSTLFLWTAQPVRDQSGVRLSASPVRVDFGAKTTAKIRVASPGEVCGMYTKTSEETLSVQAVTYSVGATTTTGLVLTTRPHLRVDGASCVMFPSKS